MVRLSWCLLIRLVTVCQLSLIEWGCSLCVCVPDEVIQTLGEGTFGKVVECADLSRYASLSVCVYVPLCLCLYLSALQISSSDAIATVVAVTVRQLALCPLLSQRFFHETCIHPSYVICCNIDIHSVLYCHRDSFMKLVYIPHMSSVVTLTSIVSFTVTEVLS